MDQGSEGGRSKGLREGGIKEGSQGGMRNNHYYGCMDVLIHP